LVSNSKQLVIGNYGTYEDLVIWKDKLYEQVGYGGKNGYMNSWL